jgi:ubiquinone/menaquinone biosynthesis C-methylase UbiE
MATSEEQFNRQASHYNAQWNQWSEVSLRWLLEHSHCSKDHHVLDVATGTGFTALAFAETAKEVIGLDVSEGMLEQARRQAVSRGIANVSFEKGAAEALRFPDGSFDLVTCRVAPHHFLSVPKFCSESYRVLRAGGRFLLADTTVPDGLTEVDQWQNKVEAVRDTSHVRNYSPSEWRSFAATAAFVVEDVVELEEEAPMQMRDWMKKSGCAGECAEQVARLFADAPVDARQQFRIVQQPDGDFTFQWMRVVLAARKP